MHHSFFILRLDLNKNSQMRFREAINIQHVVFQRKNKFVYQIQETHYTYISQISIHAYEMPVIHIEYET